MARYSVADAKNRLPSLIDKALDGEEVVITRHGRPVAELRPTAAGGRPSTGIYDWLKARRETRPSPGISSVELLNELHEADEA